MTPQQPAEDGYSPKWADDPRTAPPTTAGEKETLVAYLEYYRQTFELKCSGLTREQLDRRSMPPSTMSLHGLLRHLTGVERWWFRSNFAGEDVPLLYYTDDEPNLDFDGLDGDVEAEWALWRDECERARQIVAAHDLDDTGTRLRDGAPISLRRVLLNQITEYARHDGHADLLREGVDGTTGE